ncbi:MAG: response regulator, partial [Planctomycetota bacterium]
MTAGDPALTGDLLRVLVVEDDELVRQSIVEVLERMGCQVAAVRDAQEAVMAFLMGRFDLITLDHRMP